MCSKNICDWKIIEGDIMTQWASEVSPQEVLPEYPRPQMVRNRWMNLNGLWDYTIKPKDEKWVSDYEGKILVPFPLESALSGVKKILMPEQRLWYRRSFIIPQEWKNQKLLLHFGAVDWEAEVWINGIKVFEHTGGFYPFSYEITEFIVEEKNEIVVAVWDPTDTFGQERGKQTLKPKGLFYTPVSGIWQTVWLEPVPKNYIKAFKLTPDIDLQQLIIEHETDSNDKNIKVEAFVYEGKEEIFREKGDVGKPLKLKILNPRLWSPDVPYLYDLKIRLINNDGVIDEVDSYFGMREFSVQEDKEGIKRLFLNNKPIFQNGVLDQGYWPDGIYTAPTDAALKFDIEMTKKLGFNMTRKHIKVEPARWYYHCDKLGLIVWQDMINGGGSMNFMQHIVIPNLARGIRIKDNKYEALGRQDKENRDNYKKELKEMIDALYNVPSIGMWVPFNEAWGQFDANEICNWVKRYDQTRCVDHASGWHDQGGGDVNSLHIYFRKLKMPKNIDHRAVVISEYGGYSYLEKEHAWREKKGFGYKKCKTRDELAQSYTSLINNQLKPLVKNGVSAAVYTQLTDVETEVNGLITYDRKIVKIDSNLMKKINRIDL